MLQKLDIITGLVIDSSRSNENYCMTVQQTVGMREVLFTSTKKARDKTEAHSISILFFTENEKLLPLTQIGKRILKPRKGPGAALGQKLQQIQQVSPSFSGL